jgi:hypothetical protein
VVLYRGNGAGNGADIARTYLFSPRFSQCGHGLVAPASRPAVFPRDSQKEPGETPALHAAWQFIARTRQTKQIRGEKSRSRRNKEVITPVTQPARKPVAGICSARLPGSGGWCKTARFGGGRYRNFVAGVTSILTSGCPESAGR